MDTHLVDSGVVGSGLAGELGLVGVLFLGYFPRVNAGLPGGNSLSRDPSWVGLGLGHAPPLALVVHSLEVEGVRPGGLVPKCHLEPKKRTKFKLNRVAKSRPFR